MFCSWFHSLASLRVSYKRIISLCLSFVIVFSIFALPASAVEPTSIFDPIWENAQNFWNWVTNKPLRDKIVEFLAPGKTPETATPEDWQGAYNSYTVKIGEDYGSSIFDSSGFIFLRVPVSSAELYVPKTWTKDMCFKYTDGSGDVGVDPTMYTVSKVATTVGGCEFIGEFVPPLNVYGGEFRPSATFRLSAPIEGWYYWPNSLSFSMTGTETSGNPFFWQSLQSSIDLSGDGSYSVAGSAFSRTLSFKHNIYGAFPNGTFIRFKVSIPPAMIAIKPATGLIDITNNKDIGPTSRPGSITGITYGYQNDTGETIVYTAKDSGLFNETDGSLYNPITGETLQADSWYYDYENRRYDIALPNNQGKATLEYGNEGATITITNSGNTTNIYNYYYMVPKEDTPVDPSPSPTPPAHTHKHTSTVTTEPSCLAVGTRTYTCTCGDTYTEKIPANGHTWLIDRTVNTSYDQDGNIVQQGYTIYKCSVCGNENKVIDGTAPPGSDGDVSQGGFFGWLWGAVKKLLMKVFDAIMSLFDFITPGDGQSNFDFYNNPSTFAGGSVWE